MEKKRVGVLYGGPSGEREVSLRSSENALKNLSREKYDIVKVEVTTENNWRFEDESGTVKDIMIGNEEDEEVLKGCDVFFNLLHGTFGEDGKLQRILDRLGVPYTGSGVEASELGMDKDRSMELASAHGIRVPEYYVTGKDGDIEELAKKIENSFGYPVIVKPNDSGSTLGLSKVKEMSALREAIDKAARESAKVIVQRCIEGREFTCGILGNHDDEEIMLLPPVEIVVPENVLFDYHYKYLSKETREICPAEIDKSTSEDMQRLSLSAHKLFGCDGLSRSDFRLDDKGDLYFLETNTSPGMAEVSLCPKEAVAAGMTLSEFLDRIIDLALAKAARK